MLGIIGWFKTKETAPKKENTMKAFVKETNTGATLFMSDGAPVATYSRRRDAIRGATRRGLTIIPA